MTVKRTEITTARCIVVKVGSSSLTTRAGGIDFERVNALVQVIAEKRLTGTQIVLVSSGAIAAGLAPLGLNARPTDVATQQAAASVGQSLLVSQYAAAFNQFGITVGQVLLTAADVLRRANYRNAQRGLNRLLELGILPIVNENDTVATDEIRFGDNDRLAALVAQVVQADALILLSDVPGLFDGPPDIPGSKLISHVASMNDIADVQIGGTGSAGVGLGGMKTKVEAARIATAAGIPTIVTAADLAASVLAGSDVGTLFTAAESKIPTRLLWLTYATTSQGSIVIDDGAVAAVVDKRLSLLPAGVTSIQGMFSAGDPVDVCNSVGNVLARGIVSFDSDELPGMIGKRTADLLQEFGTGYDREIIHRDDLVIL